ncbi:DUF169 domain-containing protein [Desulfovibrio sp. OttesenSCG-928-F20]|nr:DUF169 domain-containing protein [Desulfovibrio sp. OttesenSCG-928-F20]
MLSQLKTQSARLLELLGHNEEPFGVFYSDQKPEDGYGPKVSDLLSREREDAGLINWQKVFSDFSCVLGNVWLARKKKKAAWLSHEACGCMGGGFYTGMYQPYLHLNVAYVSHGIAGTHMEGEHYITPEGMTRFMEDSTPPKAPATYCIIKPLSLFSGDEKPLVIIFFARPEVLTGLHCLTTYATGDPYAVVSPFGACCTHIIGWPQVYEAKGEAKAVLGGFDPSARKFLKTDELTFALPLSLYMRLLEKMEISALTRHTWQNDRKKVLKSQKAWGEEDQPG